MRPLLLLLLLLAWAAPPALSQDRAQAYLVDRSASTFFVVTHRSGLLSFLGHEHAILATRWSAELCFDAAAPETSRAGLTVDTHSLVIDSDSARALAGLGRGPGEGDRQEIQAKLLDASGLAADDHPELRLQTTGIVGDGPDAFALQGIITIRGIEQEVAFPVQVEQSSSGTVRFSGNLQVRQTDFGIQPESVAGVVRVSDPVDIHFDIVANEAPQACVDGGG